MHENDDAELNCQLKSELHIMQIFLLPKHPFILTSSLLLKISRLIWNLSIMEYILIMVDPRWRMLPVPAY